MNVLELTAVIWLGSLVAGLLGALIGLGGGVVVVPLLTLGFGVDIRYAIGASLVSVIATSSGAAASYVKEGYTNLRVGMLLEVATTLGALGGAAVAVWLSADVVAVVFGVVLIVSAGLSLRPVPPSSDGDGPDRLATWLKLDGSYPSPRGPRSYHVHGVRLRDMQNAARAVADFTRDRTLADSRSNLLLRSAVERQIEIIAQAAGRGSVHTKSRERVTTILR